MSQASEVEARFGEDGQVTILSFTWRGRKQPILSHGRQWGAEDGHHFLVMTTGEQIVELVYVPLSGLWHIVDAPARPLSA